MNATDPASAPDAIAIIPARGGSQRIPRKNIRAFHGRPIIAWPIAAARDSGLFTRIIVSTDDKEIAAVAREHGAEVPFTRPARLADGHTGTLAVTRHALDWLAEQDQLDVERACCLYATAPFVTPDLLRAGRTALRRQEADFAFSVTSFAFPIQRALARDENGRVHMRQPRHEFSRSQDLPESWHDAGQFYWGRVSAFRSLESLFAGDTYGVPVPRYRVQDIDTEEDWRRAELMFAALNAGDA